MYSRVLNLGFENVKRCVLKKTTLAVIIGLVFLISYSLTLFFIAESDLEATLSSNDLILYFLNDYVVSGIFLSILYVVFITGMFKDNINYMYISRLENKMQFLKAFMGSIFLSSILFISFVLLILILIAGIVKDYSMQWSSGSVDIPYGILDVSSVIEVLNPISAIVVAASMYTVGLMIIGMCYYIGHWIVRSYIGGILINSIIILIGLLSYAIDSKLLHKLSLSTNTIFSFHSLRGSGDFPSFTYSLIYILVVILLLSGIAVWITKRYVNEKL